MPKLTPLETEMLEALERTLPLVERAAKQEANRPKTQSEALDKGSPRSSRWGHDLHRATSRSRVAGDNGQSASSPELAPRMRRSITRRSHRSAQRLRWLVLVHRPKRHFPYVENRCYSLPNIRSTTQHPRTYSPG